MRAVGHCCAACPYTRAQGQERGWEHMGPENSRYSACQDLFLGSGYSSPEKEMPFSNPSPRGASFSIVTKLARDMIVVA